LLGVYKKKDMVKAASAPQYREAYPKFDVIQAQAATERQPSVCVFLLNKMIIGQLIVADSGRSSVTIAYTVGGRHVVWGEGEATLDKKFTKNMVHMDRVTISCPLCTSDKYSLYFSGSWACARCHQLMFRSQLADPRALLWERHDRLEAKVKAGRPKGMHNRTYQQLLDEFSAIRQQLAGKARSWAADDHCVEVESVWTPVSAIKELWLRDHQIRAGDVVARAPMS
jgi:ribosomal protein L37AE/L43A